MYVSGYGCLVRSYNFTSELDREITEVIGNHIEGKTNDDVELFDSYEKLINFFPQNIQNVFKNLIYLSIQSANISTISKNDLKPFGGQLKRVYFSSNNIEAIEEDLFEFTPNMEEIYVSGNKIKYVGPGTFNNLNNLSFLTLGGNDCISEHANGRQAVIELIPRIESQCKDLEALERHRKLLEINSTEMPSTTE